MSETNWTEGYVVDVPYTYGFYQHLSPKNIELCLFQKGYKSPNWQEEFTYCELGCGRGLTSIILACLYPKGKFYAIDFNPAHIDFMNNIIKSIGLNNIYYSDASFAEYSEDDNLPMFDYISYHGVYSWISAENRRNIQKIISKRLKIGGVVSVSYNTLPGWSAFSPIQYFINYYQNKESSGHIFKRLDEAFGQLEKMRENHSLYLTDENIQSRLNSVKSQSKSYLVHEYLNKDWHLTYSSEVIEEMEKVKLSYVGSADILSNIPSFNFTSSVYEHIMSIQDVKMRELVRDFYLNSQFRRDIFIKGGNPITKIEQRNWLNDLTVVRNVSKEDIQWEHRHGMVVIKLPVHFYEPVLESINEIPTKLSIVFEKANEIINQKNLENTQRTMSLTIFWECIFTLLGINYIQIYQDTKDNHNFVNKFNEFILNSINSSGNSFLFISPYTYSVVYTTYLEALFLYWEFTGYKNSLRDTVMEIMEENNLSLVDDNGNILTVEEEQVNLLNNKYEIFCKTKKEYMKKYGYLDFMQKDVVLKNIENNIVIHEDSDFEREKYFQNHKVPENFKDNLESQGEMDTNTHRNIDTNIDRNSQQRDQVKDQVNMDRTKTEELIHPKAFGSHKNFVSKPSKKR